MWYLIVSIPNLCPLSYFSDKAITNRRQTTVHLTFIPTVYVSLLMPYLQTLSWLYIIIPNWFYYRVFSFHMYTIILNNGAISYLLTWWELLNASNEWYTGEQTFCFIIFYPINRYMCKQTHSQGYQVFKSTHPTVKAFGFRWNHQYSKTCVKRPLSKGQNWVSRPIIALCRSKVLQNAPKGSILQYVWPSLSYHLSLRSLYCLFLSGRFTQVLLYIQKMFYFWSN